MKHLKPYSMIALVLLSFCIFAEDKTARTPETLKNVVVPKTQQTQSSVVPQAIAEKTLPEPAPDQGNSTEVNLNELSRRIDDIHKEIGVFESEVAKKAATIKELIKLYAKADASLAGFNGLGKVEQLELKAELYANERMARKKLSEEFLLLSGMIENCLKAKKNLEEVQRLKAFADQIAAAKAKAEAIAALNNETLSPVPAQGVLNKLDNIEYYQVKTDADLKTISSYPEVYGAPEYWAELYKANKDLIKDPEKPVPAGTRLVVPQNVKDRPDFSEL